MIEALKILIFAFQCNQKNWDGLEDNNGLLLNNYQHLYFVTFKTMERKKFSSQLHAERKGKAAEGIFSKHIKSLI